MALCHEAKGKVVCALAGVRARVRGSRDSGTIHAKFPAPTNPITTFGIWATGHT